MLFRRNGSRDIRHDHGKIIDDSPIRDSLILMIAVNTPLPEASADTVGEGEEVEVEDGIAVTEEGVGSSMADIVLQEYTFS